MLIIVSSASISPFTEERLAPSESEGRRWLFRVGMLLSAMCCADERMACMLAWCCARSGIEGYRRYPSPTMVLRIPCATPYTHEWGKGRRKSERSATARQVRLGRRSRTVVMLLPTVAAVAQHRDTQATSVKPGGLSGARHFSFPSVRPDDHAPLDYAHERRHCTVETRRRGRSSFRSPPIN